MNFELKYTGGLADRNQLPAFEGTQSLEGIARSLTAISHFVSTGQVRHKAPFSEDFSLVLEAFEPGSFKTKLRLLFKPDVVMTSLLTLTGSSIISGPIGNYTTDIITYVYKKATGETANPNTQELRNVIEKRPGEIETLQGLIIPHLKRGHAVINNGANNIIIIGDNNTISTFNDSTKDYLESIRDSDFPEIKIVSVGRFNVNSNQGGVYDHEHKRVIPFTINRNSSDRTSGRLGFSLSIYSDKENKRRFEESKIYVKFYKKTAKNGDILNYRIVDAWRIDEDLEE